GSPVALAFSPDGAHLASGNFDGNMYLWDIQGIDTSSPLSQEATEVTAMALSRDCSQLACGFWDGTVELWEISPTKRRHVSHQHHCQWVSTVEFGPDGRLFASGTYDGTIKLWNAGDGSLHGTIIAASDWIHKLTFLPDNRVAAALSDGTVWLWDSRNAELICNFDGFESEPWSHLQFSRTGTRLAYSSVIGFELRDGIGGRFIADLRCGSWPRFVLFSDDGSRIASLSRDCGLALCNTESGGLVGAVRDVDYRVLAISANGSLLATAGFDKVTLWSENRDHLAKTEVLELQRIWSMTFSVDNILAIGTHHSGIKLYNTNTHSFISTLSFSNVPVQLAFSPDCTHLAGTDTYGNLHLWDMRGIDASSTPSQEATGVTAMALSRDCSRLACGFWDGTVELWETSPTKRRIASHWQGDRVSAVGFGPDGRLFASGSDNGTIIMWNAGDGSLHGTLISYGGLRALALSNSVLVAVGKNDGTLWSLDTRSLIHTLK
ncbi:hypothetical protein M378DRAFT_47760, partial [Amanita muscaria Koide BX008]